MMTTFKSMGQSVQSLGNKAVAHPHWAGKTGFGALTLIVLAVCAVALVVVPLMLLFVGMAKNLLDGKGLTDAECNESAQRAIDAERKHERWVEFIED